MRNIIIVLCFLFLLSFTYGKIYNDCEVYGNCVDEKGTEIPEGTNLSINVNNSQYLQGLTPEQVADLYIETDSLSVHTDGVTNQQISDGIDEITFFDDGQYSLITLDGGDGIRNLITSSNGYFFIDYAGGVNTNAFYIRNPSNVSQWMYFRNNGTHPVVQFPLGYDVPFYFDNDVCSREEGYCLSSIGDIGSVNVFDQSLNTTDDVVFNTVDVINSLNVDGGIKADSITSNDYYGSTGWKAITLDNSTGVRYDYHIGEQGVKDTRMIFHSDSADNFYVSNFGNYAEFTSDGTVFFSGDYLSFQASQSILARMYIYRGLAFGNSTYSTALNAYYNPHKINSQNGFISGTVSSTPTTMNTQFNMQTANDGLRLSYEPNWTAVPTNYTNFLIQTDGGLKINSTGDIDIDAIVNVTQNFYTHRAGINLLIDSSEYNSILVDDRNLIANDGDDIILNYSVVGEANFDDTNIITTGNVSTSSIKDSNGDIVLDIDNTAFKIGGATVMDWSDGNLRLPTWIGLFFGDITDNNLVIYEDGTDSHIETFSGGGDLYFTGFDNYLFDNDITVSTLSGSGNAYACLDSDGKLYRSASACA